MSPRGVSTASWLGFAVVAAALYLLASCSSDPEPDGLGSTDADPTATATSSAEPTASAEPSEEAEPTAAAATVPTDNPELLSAWGQLAVTDGELVLAEGVVGYTLNSPLFTDYAHKLRTVRLPDGSEPASYHPDDAFDFPVGTVVTKTFYYPVDDGAAAGEPRVLKADPGDAAGIAEPLDVASVRLLETRVLVHREDGWHALPYVWNDEETEATLQRTGDLVPLTLVDGDAETPFVYVVPDVNQCSSCHAENHSTQATQPIGLKARHLNALVDLGDGPGPQLAAWERRGILAGVPDAAEIPMAAVWDDDTASIEDRTRAYLDINCAHCHNQAGAADTSGLFLEPSTEVGPSLGLCKSPVAAGTGTGGRQVGVFPGQPDESIFVYRMASTEPEAMMPELGRSLAHAEGVDLISDWITSLPGTC